MGNNNRSNEKIYKRNIKRKSKILKQRSKFSSLKFKRSTDDAEVGPKTRNASVSEKVDPAQTDLIIQKPKRPYRRRISMQNGHKINNGIKPLRNLKTETESSVLSKQGLGINSCVPSVNKSVLPQSSSVPSVYRLDSNISTALKVKHEAFVRSFAIPTHLYRYLAQRHRECPLYLDRTLTYMKSRSPNQLKTSENKHVSLDTTVEKLKAQDNFKQSLHRRVQRNSNLGNNNNLGVNLNFHKFSPVRTVKWPKKLELTFDGFYDSEKELDWLTVDASVEIQLRFGWAWRRKVCPGDTLISLTPEPIVLNTNSGRVTSPGVRSMLSPRSPNRANPPSCRFVLSDLIDLVKWNVNGGRLTSAQLEMHISATERRWLKRPDTQGHHSLSNKSTSSSNETRPTRDAKGASSSQSGRKGALGAVSYPVNYATTPLPLFSNLNNVNLSTDQPFLLTPGLYELRLGVNHADSVSSAASNQLPNGHPKENSANIVQTDSEMNKSGTCSGRIEWRRIRFPKSSKAQDEYNRWPSIRFRVRYLSMSELGGSNDSDNRDYTPHVKSPTSSSNSTIANGYHEPMNVSPCRNVSHVNGALPTNSQCTDTSISKGTGDKSTNRSSISLTYCFVYAGNLQQWSEANDLICPWCKLNCDRSRGKGYDVLLCHLRSCHPRFCFKPVWNASRTHLKLEVSLNQSYDGSNDCGLRKWGLGSKDHSSTTKSNHNHDHSISTTAVATTNGHIVGAWSGLGTSNAAHSNHHQTQPHALSLSLLKSAVRYRCPVKRLPFTHLIFWRHAKQASDQQLADPTLSVRPLVIGHNRVYHHTITAQPIRVCEFDVDSEAEDAPLWLCQHYQRKVEEFTDVNQGEKQIMRLWNAHLLSISSSTLVVCDSQIVNIVCQFIYLYAHWIHQSQLRINFILHLTNLSDYGLLSPLLVRQLMTLYERRVAQHMDKDATKSQIDTLNSVQTESVVPSPTTHNKWTNLKMCKQSTECLDTNPRVVIKNGPID